MSKVSKVLITSAILFTLSGVVFASSDATGTHDANAVRKEQIATHCEEITTRINTRVNNFDDNETKHIDTYHNVVDRIQKVVTELDTKGYDTTKLKTALAGLNDLVKTFAVDYKIFIVSLNETKEFTCGSSQGKFVAQLQDARTKLQTVHKDAENIRDYYKNTVRPAIVEIRSQKVKPTTSSK